jgi:hypothetical protein
VAGTIKPPRDNREMAKRNKAIRRSINGKALFLL